ncbi:hypothetical protein H310_07039 [Aphanomyces invadans]|uniref:Proline-rich protein PRCC n=1 Tax=Aphanomyces invadans TaxID=157072 RepID=A0A024U1X9_9STRA|nr:hypothetical protein H310_07039 [Aphanomyces invadans]ETW00401.1 hypothetical protein H310_07039 [Aphanomyces invadans]|eukprot:XP_008870536.1 hypothetical protein H310_07039 [Aphanomyces invadans]
MSLVADYGSDSDSDGLVETEASVASSSKSVVKAKCCPGPPIKDVLEPPATTPIQTHSGPPKKKAKKTLHLPPEIQKLLERGRALNSDDESDTDTKNPAPVRKQPVSKPPAGDTLLSFLPPPRLALPVRQSPQHRDAHAPVSKHVPAPPAPAIADVSQVYDPDYVSTYSFDDEHAAEDYGRGTKRRRNNDRELERLLQQGKFDAVAGKITEVKAVAPDSWQPPIDGRGYAHDREAQVLASMAGTETEGGYVISSYKPTRLQRQRHQLNQLTFDAKLREFDLMDSKAQSVKSKRETQAKYGW